MKQRFEYGDAVRLIRNVRNDGTFPGQDRGTLLVRRGAVGHVRDVGTYLQDNVIYAVDFLVEGKQVGCRDEELISAEEPWIPNRFEFREKVVARRRFAIDGEVVAELGAQGEILRVLRDHADGVRYHVRFEDRTLLLAEEWLDEAEGGEDGESDHSVSPQMNLPRSGSSPEGLHAGS